MRWKFWHQLFLVIFILFFNLFVTRVRAVESPGTYVFSEDFSMGLGNWQVARGQTSMWQVIDGVLEGRVDTGGTITELVPIDAVWQSDWRNYELELDLLPAAGVDRNLAWGYQNPQNWYEIHSNRMRRPKTDFRYRGHLVLHICSFIFINVFK